MYKANKIIMIMIVMVVMVIVFNILSIILFLRKSLKIRRYFLIQNYINYVFLYISTYPPTPSGVERVRLWHYRIKSPDPMMGHNDPKTAGDSPKTASKRPKTVSRGLQNGPRTQNGSERSQEVSIDSQESPKRTK